MKNPMLQIMNQSLLWGIFPTELKVANVNPIFMADDPMEFFNNYHPVLLLNPLRAKFFRGNINIYLHFVSFLHIDMTQVVEILPQIRQEPTYST